MNLEWLGYFWGSLSLGLKFFIVTLTGIFGITLTAIIQVIMEDNYMATVTTSHAADAFALQEYQRRMWEQAQHREHQERLLAAQHRAINPVFGGRDRYERSLLGVDMGSSNFVTSVSHMTAVREMREEFLDYTKEEFRELSHEPVIKDIMIGSHKLTKEQAAERIKAHLKTI